MMASFRQYEQRSANPIAAAIGLEALDLMVEERYSLRSYKLGEYLRGKLEALQSPLVREVRGKGLLIGMEIYTDKVSARSVCEDLKERGLLCKETHATTIRFAPPLVITKEQIDWAVGEVEAVLKNKSK